MNNTPFWHFWNPRSGAMGGFIGGLVITLVVVAGCVAAHWIVSLTTQAVF